jgi:hypothetical protein
VFLKYFPLIRFLALNGCFATSQTSPLALLSKQGKTQKGEEKTESGENRVGMRHGVLVARVSYYALSPPITFTRLSPMQMR